MILEVGTRDPAGDRLRIKTAMSHMESLLGQYNGYSLGEPSSRAGWTFFEMVIGPGLQEGIEGRFSDMISRYRGRGPERLAGFVADYFNSKGCGVRVSARG